MPDNLSASESAMESTFIYIKVLIASGKSNAYGAGYLKINQDLRKVEKIDCAMSQFTQFTQDVVTGARWHVFVDFVNKKRMSGEIAQKINEDVLRILNARCEDSEAMKAIIKAHEKSKIMDIVNVFDADLQRIFFDRNLKLEFTTEMVMQSEINEFFQQKEQESRKQKDIPVAAAAARTSTVFDLPEGKVLLFCAPIVAPVSGVPIFNLRAGTDIMIKILNNSVEGNHYNQTLKRIDEEGKILPVRATVEKVVFEEGEYRILTNIQENVYGRINETEQIKLKLYDPEEDNKGKTSDAGAAKMLPWIVGGAILIGVLILLFSLL